MWFQATDDTESTWDNEESMWSDVIDGCVLEAQLSEALDTLIADDNAKGEQGDVTDRRSTWLSRSGGIVSRTLLGTL